ncbi:MAG: MlaD family protein [Verrucomicrobiae bacterium]|nr:MlaD family protein [Verrucomicrobiae bacterium]
MDNYQKNLAQVGFLTLVALVVLGVSVWVIGRFTTKPQQEIRVGFNFANSLASGAPVRIAGVYAGKISHIRLLTDKELEAGKFQIPRIEVTARVDQDIYIPKDSTATITASGLLSEKYLEISPGDYAKGRYDPKDLLAGVDPVPLDKMLASVHKVVDELDATLGHINLLASSVNSDLPGVIKGLDSLLVRADGLVSRADSLAATADGLVTGNRAEIENLIENMQRASVNLKFLSRTLAERPWKMVLPAFPVTVPPDDLRSQQQLKAQEMDKNREEQKAAAEKNTSGTKNDPVTIKKELRKR